MKVEDRSLSDALTQAFTLFSDPHYVRDVAVELVCPTGLYCPSCEGSRLDAVSWDQWRCRNCCERFTLQVASVFQHCQIGVDRWLSVMWVVANGHTNVTAYEIHDALAISLPAARYMLNRIRTAMRTEAFRAIYGDCTTTLVRAASQSRRSSPVYLTPAARFARFANALYAVNASDLSRRAHPLRRRSVA